MNTTSEDSPIKLATSLFSLAYEWNSRQYSLDDLMAETKRVALGNGLEIIGFQSLRGFPKPSKETIREVQTLIEKHEFEPVCLDANVDIALRRHRYLTVDETVEYIRAQLRVAEQLGFPVLRVQMMAKPEVMRRLAPHAEKANVKLGMELHTPYDVTHPAVIALRELYAELDTPYLGFIPDCGTSMRAIPDALLSSFRQTGVTDALIDLTREIWQKDLPMPVKFGELQERAASLGATPPQIGRLNMAFSMNGRQSPERWTEIVPQTVHLHGKFYGFDDAGNEPSIDYAAILKVFFENGYRGYIASEYEGSAFTDAYSSFDMVHRHQVLCQRILNELTTHYANPVG